MQKIQLPQKTIHLFQQHSNLLAGIVLLSAIILIILLWISKRNKNKDVLVTKIRLMTLKMNSEEKHPEFIIPENPFLAAHEKLVAAG